MKSVLKTIWKKKKKEPSEGLVSRKVLAQSEWCQGPPGPSQCGCSELAGPGLPVAPGREPGGSLAAPAAAVTQTGRGTLLGQWC